MKENKAEKGREATRNKLLEAVGLILNEEGFDKVGVNAVAAKAGVSKMLIYRYFESVDNMIIEYLSQNSLWEAFAIEFPKNENLREFTKTLISVQISNLRENKILRELYRWELTGANNTVIDKLRLKRESKGVTLATILSQLLQHPQEEVATLATLLSSSINYLVLLENSCPVFNGIDINQEQGWKQIICGVDKLIDLWFDDIEKRR
ncbi:AcrR family transcriptional regulator [Dysgonomonas sp. PH5-45]|uniref:TetR/AcrR family transcriptional regulator n=1 Tax=unclassified Dysgonomonas TaxID=2630389 RepID=UPI002472F45C|nr:MULTISPECIES: TetR/AcrR family transcriptional regulator [unclassified Dysgonomonas]MDH6353954.1 AcrR family transcriptional regulator [Dysgonomonas sp. PH5-45]MDH6386856.1 AcrR family transcriptional regulator [Dysgonomonas sp. PH5-37]